MKKKRVLYINLSNYGSTGKIVEGLAGLCEKEGYEVLKCYPKSKIGKSKRKNDYVICSEMTHKVNRHLAANTGLAGCFAIISTIRLIYVIRRFDPNIIHLHNIHGDYVNLPILFRYLKRCKKSIIWTLHDCWSFTGRCPYFQMSKCLKWKTGCTQCPFPKSSYPQSRIDTSKLMWRKKRNWFTGIDRMTLVTPSQWLAEIVGQSFLKEYPISVIYNGIDLSIFHPTPSNIKEEILSTGGYIVLGVAFSWSEYKGLDVFEKLCDAIRDEYHIVLVGVDKKQKERLHRRIRGIDKCSDQLELAKIYTCADVMLNPTREEVLGLTNIEALACGTPVITFNTGGSPECVDKDSGVVIQDNNSLEEIICAIKRICTDHKKEERKRACISRASEFDEQKVYMKYLRIYSSI